MRLPLFALSMLLCGSATSAQRAVLNAPPLPIAPYVRAAPREMFVTWTARNVRCAGNPIAFTRAPAAMPAMSWGGATSPIKSFEYRFTIDAKGRPGGIKRLSSDYAPGFQDLSPALAVSQFAAGAPQGACSLTFVPKAWPIEAAPVQSVMAYTLFPPQPPTAAMWARTRPAGSTCFDPVPQVRLRAFPAFDGLPKQPGQRSWSMIGYDLDKSGKPIHRKPVAGNGNAALEAASLKAVAQSRFAPGARTGCQYPYWLAAATLPPPPAPEEASFRPAGATCPGGAQWAVPPTLNYPPNFRRRSIEGWAVIGYDVASWGATGNVRILDAQPAAEFGEEAMRIIASAKRVPSSVGYTGCVDRVLFKMGPTTRRPGGPPVVFDPPQPSY